MTNKIPTPEDLWGDCEVDWEPRHKNLWKLWLKGIASIIIFAEQHVIDRVNKDVRLAIEFAKSGKLSPTNCILIISPAALISFEEWEIIGINAQKHGKIVSKLFLDNDSSSENN